MRVILPPTNAFFAGAQRAHAIDPSNHDFELPSSAPNGNQRG
jgi:hypothetical protein